MAQNNNQSQNDSTMTIVMSIVLLAGVGYLLNRYYGAAISDIIISYRKFQIDILSLFSSEYEKWSKSIRFHQASRKLDWNDAVALSLAVCKIIRYPAAILILYFCWWAGTKSPRMKFKTVHDFESLIAVQEKVWGAISPITKVNPALSSRPAGAVPTALAGTWAEAMSPQEWCHYHRAMGAANTPDPVAARRAFASQLGTEWAGVDQASPHARALIAAFLLFIDRKRDDARKLLRSVARSWRPDVGLALDPKLRKKINAIIKKNSEILNGLSAMHGAHTNVFMCAVLDYARRRAGIIQPALFIWLRPVDRDLWYALHGLPPPSTKLVAKLVEGAGTLAHYEAEKVLGRPSREPLVDAALSALSASLEIDDSHRPDEWEAALQQIIKDLRDTGAVDDDAIQRAISSIDTAMTQPAITSDTKGEAA